jgi:hypothetical protein
MFAWGARKTPDVSASMRVEEEEKDARIEIACGRRSRWWSVHSGLVTVLPFTSARRCYMKKVNVVLSAPVASS